MNLPGAGVLIEASLRYNEEKFERDVEEKSSDPDGSQTNYLQFDRSRSNPCATATALLNYS